MVRFGLDEEYELETAKKLIDQDILNLIFSKLGLAEENRQIFTDSIENETRKMLAAQLTKLKWFNIEILIFKEIILCTVCEK